MSLYIAISGAAGMGKTTSLVWLNEYLKPSMSVVVLPDSIEQFDENSPNEELVPFLCHHQLKRDAIVREYLNSGVTVLCDRTCLDPLALAMTLLSEHRWQALEKWYNQKDFVYGHHILLDAPHSVIRDRRIKRGSSPRSTFLRSLDMSQAEYEANFVKNWRFIHTVRNIPFYEVDFSSQDPETNRNRVIDIIKPLITTAANNTL